MPTAPKVTANRTDADNEAVPFSTVLKHELDLIEQRRSNVLGAPVRPRAAAHSHSSSPPLDSEVQDAQRLSTCGVAFSGGGIRSATFNLGVLQGLAEHGFLKYIDYLSTVSGGGYMGAWLHGVIYRTPDVANRADKDEIARGQLSRAEATLRSGVKHEPGPSDQDPITFLRKYSNYLAPRPGLFSADTWTIGFIWVRNVLLNQLILAPAIAALVSLTLLLTFWAQYPSPVYVAEYGFDLGGGALAFVCLAAAGVIAARHLAPIARRSKGHTDRKSVVPRGSTGMAAVPLVFIAMLALGSAHFEATFATRAATIVIFIAILATIQLIGGFIECYTTQHGEDKTALAWLNVLWMSGVSGIVGGALTAAAWDVIGGWSAWTHLAIGPPLLGLCFMLTVMLLIGLMGADYPDGTREWTARIGSVLAIVSTAWLALFGLMVFGPWAVTWTLGNFYKSGAAAMLLWIATTIGGVLAGRSAQTKNGTSSTAGRVLEILIWVAPTVFLAGYIVAIATAVHAALPSSTAARARADTVQAENVTVSVQAPPGTSVDVAVMPDQSATLQRWLQPAADFAQRYPDVLRIDRAGQAALGPLSVPAPVAAMLLVLGATAAVAFVASRRVNINEFSLHHFYKNRLVRCYLGASNLLTRREHPLTGFDPLDDLPLARLCPDDRKAPYFGPYPIINTALNLNAGAELATQERKATSFVFTPKYCGFSTKSASNHGRMKPRDDAEEQSDGQEPRGGDEPAEHGYRPSDDYAYSGGPNVGTAIAISGAAANPNWGHHTSRPMAFLLTVFNARLGWWLGNPRWRDACREPGPRFALKYLFAELLGQTTARSQFVNLSDGGHFDNLGLYELVRRRCRFIVVCDAEEDRHLTFGSLGGAIRKCRADFGVEIDIDPQPIRQPVGMFGKAHCVVGRIVYPEPETAFWAGPTAGFDEKRTDPNSRGWLLYIKSSLTGDEPADVLEYQSQHPEFPHQSTADQFFSESQFESYRRLGYHVLRSAFAGVTMPADVSGTAKDAGYPLVGTFQELMSKWYAPIPVSPEAATRLADAYVVLMRRIAENKDLEYLNYELVHGKKAPGDSRPLPDATPAEVAAGMDLIQLMQNVYTEFGFESALNRANPRNSGWMNVFRKWSDSPILFKRVWPTIQRDYHSLFQTFVRGLPKYEGNPERP